MRPKRPNRGLCIGMAAALCLVCATPGASAIAGPGKAIKPAVRSGKSPEAKKSPPPGKRGKTNSPKPTEKQPAPREHDPLEGAWPDAKSPRLGNGSLRSEVLVAAMRMKGMKGSFDPDSFFRHVCYVTGLARKSEWDADAWNRGFLKRIVAHQLLIAKGAPRRGDLAFFSLDAKAPRSPKADPILAGVIDSVARDRVTVLAPVGNRVVRLTASLGGKAGKNDTALLPCQKPAGSPAKSVKKGKPPPPKKPPVPAPCRAGDLFLGFADIDAVGQAFPLNALQPGPRQD